MANEQSSATLMRKATLDRTASYVLLAICIGLSTAFGACSDASRRVVEDIFNRTIPPGDTVPTLSDNARASQSVEFTWEFGTHLNATEYAEWLKTRLRDFQLVKENGAELYLGKQIDGDAYRLHVTLHGEAAGTRVHVQLTASPD